MNVQATQRVQRSFSRSFETYHQSASLQAQIAGDLVRHLLEQDTPAHFGSAVELGCGTGHLSQKLRATFDIGTLTLNDLSPEAVTTAQAVDADFLCGDARGVNWPIQPDLIASSSMVQWLPDPAEFLRKAADALVPGGWLAVSGFGPEQYRELVQIGSSASAPGLCNPRALSAAIADKMEVLTCGGTLQTLHFDTPRAVLKHLRDTGVNGRAQSVWTKTRLAAFTADYTAQFGGAAGVSLTYHPTWIIARKRG